MFLWPEWHCTSGNWTVVNMARMSWYVALGVPRYKYLLLDRCTHTGRLPSSTVMDRMNSKDKMFSETRESGDNCRVDCWVPHLGSPFYWIQNCNVISWDAMVNKIKRSNIKRQIEIYLSKLYYIVTLNLDRNDLSIVQETILVLRSC